MFLASPCIVNACIAPIELTLEQIYVEYSWSIEDELQNRQIIQKILDTYKLEILPTLGRGDLKMKRVLRPISQDALIDLAIKQISKGESSACEFKSSIAFDRKKFEHAAVPKKDCYSDNVLFSLLKAVASFLNTDGGTLFVGIDDDGNYIGIEDDFECIPNIKPNFDGADLFLRSKIQKHFIEGDAVGAYVKSRQFSRQGKLILECAVAKRSNLSFLKAESGTPKLYIRRGTSSSEISFQDIEQFFELRRSF